MTARGMRIIARPGEGPGERTEPLAREVEECLMRRHPAQSGYGRNPALERHCRGGWKGLARRAEGKSPLTA